MMKKNVQINIFFFLIVFSNILYCQDNKNNIPEGIKAYYGGDYKKTIRLLENNNNLYKEPEAIYGLSKSYFLTGLFGNAINVLSKALNTKPNEIKYLSLRAECYSELKEYDKAYYDYNNINIYYPDSLDYYLKKSWIKYLNNDTIGALSDIENIINKEPLYTKAFNQLGVIYLNNNDLDTARSLFSYTLNLEPDNDEAYYNLGIIEMRINPNIIDAVKYFQKVNKTSPYYFNSCYNLGYIYYIYRKYEACVYYFDISSKDKCDYQDKSVAYLEEVNSLLKKYKKLISTGLEYENSTIYRWAIDNYLAALQIYPENTDVLIRLSKIYLTIEKIDSALISVNKLLEIYPNNIEGMNLLKKIYAHMKKEQKIMEEEKKHVKYEGKVHFLNYNYMGNELYYQLLESYNYKIYYFNIIEMVKGKNRIYQSYCNSFLDRIIYSIEIHCGDNQYYTSKARMYSYNGCAYDIMPSGFSVLDDHMFNKLYKIVCDN